MPTINSVSGATVAIPAGRVLMVSSAGEAYVDLVSGPVGAGYTSTRVAQGSAKVGPFMADATVFIRPQGSEEASYEFAAAAAQVEADVDQALGLPTGLLRLKGVDGTGASAIRVASRPRITIIGDSQVKNSTLVGISVTATGAPGITDIANLLFERGWPTGNATFEVDYNKRRGRVAANGETFGPWVKIAGGGVFRLYSSGGKHMTVFCRARSYSASGVVTVTANVIGDAWWTYGTGNFAGLLDALTGHRIEIAQPLLGVPGDSHLDVDLRLQQAIDQGSHVIWSVLGTNSIVAAGLTPAQTLALEFKNYQRATAAGCIWISTAILPRFGPEGDNGYTLSLQQDITNYNNMLYAMARQYPNWYVVDADGAADFANNWRALANMTTDGLHVKAGMSIISVRQAVSILEKVWPTFRASPKLASSAQVYDAVKNPGGNLLTNGLGSLITGDLWAATTAYALNALISTTGGRIYRVTTAGTSGASEPVHTSGAAANGTAQMTFVSNGGTAGTGVTMAPVWAASTAYAVDDVYITGGRLYRVVVAGTSGTTAPVHTAGVATDGTLQAQYLMSGVSAIGCLPAGWSFQRLTPSGTSMTGKAYKYRDADGQGLGMFMTSAIGGETIWGWAAGVSNSNMALGDIVDLGADFHVIGEGCYGVAVTMIPDGPMRTSSDVRAGQLMEVESGFEGKATVCVPPGNGWIPGVTNSAPIRLYAYSKAGGAFVCKMSNAFVRKVLS